MVTRTGLEPMHKTLKPLIILGFYNLAVNFAVIVLCKMYILLVEELCKFTYILVLVQF